MLNKIALVEDNPDNRLLTQAILEMKYEVISYEDGPEALNGFRQACPDLILLDISLPGMDGVEVLRNLRKIKGMKKIPVIALTAHALPGDRERFLSEGFNDYLTKPVIDDTELFDMIEKWS